MKSDNNSEMLSRLGIKPTANRLVILEEMLKFNDTFSLNDLSGAIVSMDRSTIFRTLTLYLDRNLIHSAFGDNGSIRYYVCKNNGDCAPSVYKCHFYCEECGQTFNIESEHIPVIELPAFYAVREANYLLKGTCVACRRKRF
jgi:Fur family ferric uptake transcriptional regulator